MKRIGSIITLFCLTIGLMFASQLGVFAEDSVQSASTAQGNNVFKSIVAVNSATIAIRYDGTVIAWGFDNQKGLDKLTGIKTVVDNFYRACALKEDGTVVDLDNRGDMPKGLDKVKDIVSGYDTTMALIEDGTLVVWGGSKYGECIIPKGLSKVKAIASGDNYKVALKEDGTVVAWGDNQKGQCNVPTGLAGVKAISARSSHTVALKEDGTVVEWGSNLDGQCNVPTGLSSVKEIAAGSDHTIALREDGTVVAWGSNSYGQCNVPAGLSGVKEIASGVAHSVALKEDGSIVAWGNNFYGQCTIMAGTAKVKAVESGYGNFYALKEDGTVIGWGDNSSGQCIIPAGLNRVKAITAGFDHAAALKEDGTVVTWGDNSSGQCNIPSGLTGVKAITAGWRFAAALKEDGTVVAWGDNSKGQCNVPAGLTGIKAISAGWYHMLALKEDGTIVAWGDNSSKQCTIPAGLTGVKAIDGGLNHSVALKEDGTVAAWGSNSNGQCAIPAGMTGVKAIVAGGEEYGECFTVTIKEDGTAAIWGKYGVVQYVANMDLSHIEAMDSKCSNIIALKEDGSIIGQHYKAIRFYNGGGTITSRFAIPYERSLKYIPKNSINPSTEEFNLSNLNDINIQIGENSGKLLAVKNGCTPLTNADYSIEGNTVTIRKSYLTYFFSKFNQPGKKLYLTFDFDNSNDPVLTINPTGAANSIKCNDNTFDPLNPHDLIVEVTDGTLKAIKNGQASLNEFDYNFASKAVIIKKSYLTYFFNKFNQPLYLTFDFENGNDPILTVNPLLNSIMCDSPFFDQTNPQDVILKTTGGKLIGIKNGTGLLTGADYSIYGNNVIIKKSYLSYFFNKFTAPWQKLNLSFDFESGNDPVFIVNRVPISNFVRCDNPAFDPPNPKDITVKIAGGNLTAIKNGAASLTSADYSISGDVVTIKKSYLSYFHNKFGDLQKLNLLFDFERGNDQIFTVSMIPTTNFISCENPVFNLSDPQDITAFIAGDGRPPLSIKNGSASLTSSDYSATSSTLTIKKSYLIYFFSKFTDPWQKLNLTVDITSGNDPLLTISKRPN